MHVPGQATGVSDNAGAQGFQEAQSTEPNTQTPQRRLSGIEDTQARTLERANSQTELSDASSTRSIGSANEHDSTAIATRAPSTPIVSMRKQHNLAPQSAQTTTTSHNTRTTPERPRTEVTPITWISNNGKEVGYPNNFSYHIAYRPASGDVDYSAFLRLRQPQADPLFVLAGDKFEAGRYQNISFPDSPDELISDLHTLALSIQAQIVDSNNAFAADYTVDPPQLPDTQELDMLFNLVAHLNNAGDKGMTRAIHEAGILPQAVRVKILDVLHSTGFPVTQKALSILGSADVSHIPADAKSSIAADSLPTVRQEMAQKAEDIHDYLSTMTQPLMRAVLTSPDVKSNKLLIADMLNGLSAHLAKTYNLEVNNHPAMMDGKWWTTSQPTTFERFTNTGAAGGYWHENNRGNLEVSSTLVDQFAKGNLVAGIKLFTTLGHEMLHRHQDEQLYRGDGEYKQYALLMKAGEFAGRQNEEEMAGAFYENPNKRQYLYMASEEEKETHTTQRYWADALINAFNNAPLGSHQTSRNHPQSLVGRRVENSGRGAHHYPYQNYEISYTVNGRTKKGVL